MYGANVFAVLLPNDYEGLARDAFRLAHNAELYHKSSKGILTEPGLSSREPTPALSTVEPDESLNVNDNDRLILTFDSRPKDPLRGWQFGTCPKTSDILLGHRGTRGISARHFSINIDDGARVVLRDNSTYGTSVSYNGQAEYEVRRNFKWILSLEPENAIRLGEIVIHIPGPDKLAFRIQFPNLRQGTLEYLSHYQIHTKTCRTTVPSVDALGLDSSTTTIAPSQSQTPRQAPIYVNLSLIGQGEFGAVHRVFDVSSGNIYAGKRFHPPSGKGVKGKRKQGYDDWMNRIRNEMDIMKQNPHTNIMPFIAFLEAPDPLLVMPFYRLGTLDSQEGVTEQQYVSAFHQILLGLRHLHARNIVHRDLKPSNLLVAEPFTIIIADFGLSKDATDHLLTTFCGTHIYAAPEVYPGHSDGYGPLVDVWSTGVIILELMYGCPPKPATNGVTISAWNKYWSKLLVHAVEEWDPENDMVIDILTHMVRIAPEERLSADRCLQRGFNSGLFSRSEYVDERVSPGLENDVVTPTTVSVAGSPSSS